MRSLPHAPSPLRQGPHLQAEAFPQGHVQALARRRMLDQQQRTYQGMHTNPRKADTDRQRPS